MKKAFLLASILFISVISTACINNFAVQEHNNKAKDFMDKGDYVSAIERLKSSVDLDGSVFETQYNFPLALIVGNEAKGISSTIKKASDQLIYIPMNGTVQSLNVSIATAVLLFEIVKKAHNI